VVACSRCGLRLPEKRESNGSQSDSRNDSVTADNEHLTADVLLLLLILTN